MNEQKHKPLILVVDDNWEYREDLLPSMAQTMGCRVCKAGTVHDALRLAGEHTPDSGDPLALVVLDMHLPVDDLSAAAIAADGGIQFLQPWTSIRSFHGYRLTKCPIVVFTAYPSFAECVAAIQAGADAYIPKVQRDNEGGPDALRETCERLLRSREHAAEVPPTRDWIERNHKRLTAEYNGRWVAFVSRESVRGIDIQDAQELDGVVLLSGDSYEAVRARVIKLPSVLEALPPILMVRGNQSVSKKGKE